MSIRTRGWKLDLFLEGLIAAAGWAVIESLQWCLKRIWKGYKRRKRAARESTQED